MAEYVHSQSVWRNSTPLTLSIWVPAQPKAKGAELTKMNPILSQIVYNCVLAYLGKLCQKRSGEQKSIPYWLVSAVGGDLVLAFKNQFPFILAIALPVWQTISTRSKCPIRGGCSFLEHPEANVLAVSCFLVLHMLSHLKTHQVHWQKTLLSQAKLHAQRTHGIHVHHAPIQLYAMLKKFRHWLIWLKSTSSTCTEQWCGSDLCWWDAHSIDARILGVS